MTSNIALLPRLCHEKSIHQHSPAKHKLLFRRPARGDDYYISLVGELFDRLHAPYNDSVDWSRLGNAITQAGGVGVDQAPAYRGILAPEAAVLAAAAFYFGGYSASAYLTLKAADPAALGEIQRACYELLSRPTTIRSARVRALIGAARQGNLETIRAQSEQAAELEAAALQANPDEWVGWRLFRRILSRFEETTSIKAHPWPPLVATELVFRFLAIHPFTDGNGRLGRALFLMALLQGDDPALQQVIGFISIDRQIERHRALYYTTLQQASNGRFQADPRDYQLEPLAWFFSRTLDLALSDVALLRQRYAALQRLSASAAQLLACFRAAPERRLTPADLMDQTGLVRRTVQNGLRALLEAGFVQRLGAGRGTRYQLVF